jgi:hypothetical protein
VDAGRFDLLAQPVDVDLDGIGGDFFAPFAQQVDELVLADHAAAARQEDFQQAGLAGGQFDGGVVDGGHAPVQVEGEAPVAQDGCACAAVAADQCAHAGFEFAEGEGFGHVVVGAQVQAFDALLDGVGRRQDQDRQGRASLAQLAQHGQAVQARQAQIEDQQIEGLQLQRGIGAGSIVDDVHGIAFVAQRSGQPVRENAVVLGNQDTHGGNDIQGEAGAEMAQGAFILARAAAPGH